MKIGFDAKRAYHNYTGLGNYSRDLISSLLKCYPLDEYHLYSPKENKNKRLFFLKEYVNVFSHFPKSYWNKKFKSFWRSLFLERYLLQDKIEIYHGLSNEIPKRKKGGGIKYVVTIHDLIFKRFPDTYKVIDRNIYDRKFKYAALNSDKIIAISEQTKRDIVSFYGVSPHKIEVVYQSCHENFKKKYKHSTKEAVRVKYNLPESFLLNVGTIETRKNLEALIESIPLMENTLPIVVIGGKTDYYEFILTKIKELKIPKSRVVFLENVSITELPVIYQLATLFVYPSIFEGFGIPIIEALYSGIPVITTKGGCFSEAGGQFSLYVDTQNYLELAEAIDKLLLDEKRQKKMIIEGEKYVKKFDSQIITQQLHELYKTIIREG